MGIASLIAPSSGVTQRVQEFTASGTWVCPSNVNTVTVFAVGGGGGGGAANGSFVNSTFCGGGGGGGEIVERQIAVVPGTTYSVTIGGGGSGVGAGVNAAGGIGSSTTFGSLLTVLGGGGGGTAGNGGSYSFFNHTYAATGGGQGVSIDSASGFFGAGGAGGGAFENAFTNITNSTLPRIARAATGNINNPSPTAGGNGSAGVFDSSGGGRQTIAGRGLGRFGNGGPGGNYCTSTMFPMSASIGTAPINSAAVGLVTGNSGAANTGNGGAGGSGSPAGGGNSLAGGGNGGSGYLRLEWWQ